MQREIDKPIPPEEGREGGEACMRGAQPVQQIPQVRAKEDTYLRDITVHSIFAMAHPLSPGARTTYTRASGILQAFERPPSHCLPLGGIITILCYIPTSY
jgi:hypothetical protein